METGTHTECLVLSSLFRGNLCEQLTSRPGRHYGADQRIYHAGDESHEVYYLRSGLVKVLALSADGREVILDIHKPGEIFGFFCLCGAARADSAVAMEDSDVVVITLANLVERLSESRDALEGFILTVCQRLTRAYDAIQELAFESVPARLAHTLLRLADEMGRETDHGVELEHYITQEELAQMLSARREVVSTALGRMRERGFVEYTRGGKLTINRQALVDFIEGKEMLSA
jgi:CRP/FNR family transcriptional regulator, cyclic AMP receptor protein